MKGPIIKPLRERFWAKVNKRGPLPDPVKYPLLTTRCWEWAAGTNGVGYGLMYCPRPGYCVKALATHISWFLHYGRWPKKDLLHSCDNPPCTNPEHLSEGTHKQNIQQSVARGRNWEKRKTHCPQGHPYSEENTQTCRKGGRHCRICVQERPHSSDYYFLQCGGCMEDIVVHGKRYRQGVKKGQKAFYCNYRCFKYNDQREKAGIAQKPLNNGTLKANCTQNKTRSDVIGTKARTPAAILIGSFLRQSPSRISFPLVNCNEKSSSPKWPHC